jgi:3-hydroxyisobutyrate dehydrogenase-like beta-hydroxyacid dehydrogenase
MNVGFIGLGNMGAEMARNLFKAGHHLIVYNRTPAKAETLVTDGAQLAQTVSDACRGEIVFTMLADDAAVEAVVFGEGGLRESLPARAIHICMSTISIALSERLERVHLEQGQSYGAAPVFGRPEAAAQAKLFIIAAGPAEAIEKCRPLFEAMGQKTFVVGTKPSAANLIKLSGNFLIAATIESLGEAGWPRWIRGFDAR